MDKLKSKIEGVQDDLRNKYLALAEEMPSAEAGSLKAAAQTQLTRAKLAMDQMDRLRLDLSSNCRPALCERV